MQSVIKVLLLVVMVLCLTCHDGSEQPTGKLLSAQEQYELALAALDKDSVRQGETLLRQAITQAEQESDFHTRYLAELRLAESLSWGNTAAALELAKQALATYERHPDSERNHIILLDYIGTYASQLAFNEDGSFDEALAYTRLAYELALASRDSLGTEQVCQTLTSLANIYWAMDDFKTALRYARQAEACAPEELLLGTQQVLARCLVSCDSLSAAEAVYRRMQPGDDLQTTYIIQSNLAKLAMRRSDTEAAEAAIDSAFQNAEELYYQALRQKDDYYQTALQQERENERLHYRAVLQRRMLWGGLLLALVLVAAAAFVVRSRLRQRALLHEQEMQRHQHELQLHQQEAEAQREQLRQRDGAIEFLKNFILERSAVIQKLDASSERHITLLQREWAEIERTLDAIDNDRFARLRQRFPELKEEDLQLCILTRLRLTNRAIGNIYGVSISAVQHRKLRIKKDIFHEEDPDIPFEQVLNTL
ncbi:MAG: hypothetical protein IJT75_02085 [Bacteroidaceae bacterium]|nr:hypothetical protein [Bacteroidaceae bacterium]